MAEEASVKEKDANPGTRPSKRPDKHKSGRDVRAAINDLQDYLDNQCCDNWKGLAHASAKSTPSDKLFLYDYGQDFGLELKAKEKDASFEEFQGIAKMAKQYLECDALRPERRHWPSQPTL